MKKIIPIIIVVLSLCQAGASVVRADDTDIYGTTTITISPMFSLFSTHRVVCPPRMSPESRMIRLIPIPDRRQQMLFIDTLSGSYTLFTGNVNNITCASIKNALLTKGYAATGTGGIDNINTTTFACGSKPERCVWETGSIMTHQELEI